MLSLCYPRDRASLHNTVLAKYFDICGPHLTELVSLHSLVVVSFILSGV